MTFESPSRRTPADAEAPARRDPARTRARLLEAAVAEFGDHGFSGARTDRIAPWMSADERDAMVRRALTDRECATWYPGNTEHGRDVPTWNYTAAHAHGVPRVIGDRDGLLALLSRLTDAHETRQPSPWRVADAPAPFIDQLMRAIVGIEIPIDRLEGKLKASQDEAWADREGTVNGLRACPGEAAQAMADLIQKALDTDTKP